jgi:hypothetical protein
MPLTPNGSDLPRELGAAGLPASQTADSIPQVESAVAPSEVTHVHLCHNCANRLLAMEARVASLEEKERRFTEALVKTGEMVYKNPATKMMLAAFPKEVQNRLKEFFNANEKA